MLDHVDPGGRDPQWARREEGVVDGGRGEAPDGQDDDEAAHPEAQHRLPWDGLFGREVSAEQAAAPALHGCSDRRRRLGHGDPLAHGFR